MQGNIAANCNECIIRRLLRIKCRLISSTGQQEPKLFGGGVQFGIGLAAAPECPLK